MWAYRLDGPGFVSRYERPDDAQTAYSLYARPQAGRLKVAIVA